MLSRSRTLGLLSAAGLCMATGPALAQPVQSNNVRATGQPGSNPFTQVDVFDVDFPGGTLSEYLGILKASTERASNLIIPADAADIPTRPVKLRMVSLTSCLQLLQSICDVENGAKLYSEEFFDGQSYPVIKIIYRKKVEPADFQRLEPYSVSRLTDRGKDGKPSADRVLTAVTTALRMLEEQDRAMPTPRLTMHQESGVLLIMATKEQHESIRELLATMERDVSLDAAQANQDSAESGKRQLAHQLAKADYDLSLARTLSAEKKMQRAQAMRDSGALDTETYDDLVLQFKAAQIEQSKAQARVEAAAKGVDFFERGADRGGVPMLSDIPLVGLVQGGARPQGNPVGDSEASLIEQINGLREINKKLYDAHEQSLKELQALRAEVAKLKRQSNPPAPSDPR